MVGLARVVQTSGLGHKGRLTELALEALDLLTVQEFVLQQGPLVLEGLLALGTL